MRTQTVAQFFGLRKSQGELDFVDVPINGDISLFVDPFAISQRPDRWSQQCHLLLTAFFQRVVDSIREGRQQTARELLQHLQEPNETRFGYSKSLPQGAGIGPHQADQLFEALLNSSAVKTGFIHSLEECELMIEGISRDKISDLTTNILRRKLAEYTKEQCELLGIPTRPVALAPYYSAEANAWVNDYLELPVARGKPILLVPKIIARYDLAYDHQQYYQHSVLDYLQAEALNAGSSLVRTLRNGRRVVYKKDIQAIFPCTKENLFRFSREHPEVLRAYREKLIELEQREETAEIETDEEKILAASLATALQSIPSGSEAAGQYHNLMIGIVEFLFFPNLLYPKKEQEIHQGRKRIDIVMENGAKAGIFARLHEIRKLPCAFAALECKNYATDVANPELDQLAGRFSPNRGKLGVLCCRSFDDRATFIERCRDTFRDDRGLIIPLSDESILAMLSLIADGQRPEVDRFLTDLIDGVWYS